VCEKIIGFAPFIRNLAGVTKLKHAIALIAGAQAVVSNDSGLMHIAAALNRPVIGLYGPTDPDHTPPVSELAKVLSLRLECAPCKQRRCPLGHRDCMRKLLPEQVWSELKPMLPATHAPSSLA
jgi:heptosyltransferase II